uniref:Uncharacterized protein n=1 Tax=Chlorobium chlorochromatii (strain CaD3) TaxID=340177 RepID=Q3ASC5_CHLCH
MLPQSKVIIHPSFKKKIPMKSLLLAFAICVTITALCFVTLEAVGMPQDISKTISVMVLGAFPKLREMLEKMEGERSGGAVAVAKVQSFGDFNVSTSRALLYVTIVGFVALEFASGITGVVLALLGAQLSNIGVALQLLTMIIAYPIIFLAGRWIGRRCSQQPYMVAALAGLTIRLSTTIFDIAMVPMEQLIQIYQGQMQLSMIIVSQVGGSVLFALLLMAGAFVGSRQRLVVYVQYLLSRISPQSRLALVDLAHEEAVKMQKESGGK